MRLIVPWVLFVAVAVTGACSGRSGESGPPTGKALVTVNGTAITDAELIEEISQLPDFAKEDYQGETGLRRFLDELITRELLYRHARDRGLDKDEEYRRNLRAYEKAKLSSMVIQKELAGTGTVSDEQAKKFFDERKNDFQVPEKIQVAHILVKTEEEAASLRKQIEKGASFQKLASEKSLDRESAAKGGELEPFAKGSMVPEFEAVAFGLKIGQISEPVKTAFGYHLIRLINRFEAEQVEYDRISTFIKDRMEDELKQTAFANLSKELRGKASISAVDEAALKTILGRMDAKAEDR